MSTDTYTDLTRNIDHLFTRKEIEYEFTRHGDSFHRVFDYLSAPYIFFI